MKLIASDLDGTLLRHGSQEISQEMFHLIRAFHAQGVRFCAASGRQYHSLRDLFAPVADQVLFLCENGGIVFDRGEILAKTPIPRQTALAISHAILDHPACEVLISGASTSYLMPKNPAYYSHIRYFLGNHVTLVHCPEDITEDILKVSAYCPDGAAAYDRLLGDPWRGQLQVAVAGEVWLDFTQASKAVGLHAISQRLHIPAEEMVSFGDNFNDLTMLRYTGQSYAMDTAALPVQQAAGQLCHRVEDTLTALYQAKFGPLPPL